MTTDEKIKALVQSYVDELFAHDDMSDQENIEAKNDAFVMCMAFAGHILENHCIVEKSKLRELDFFGHVKRHQYGCLTKDNAEYLFGKEIFNGTDR